MSSYRKEPVISHSSGVLKRALVTITLVSFLSGCIMVPKTHEFAEPRCKLFTKKLALKVKELDFSNAPHTNANPVGLVGLPFALAYLFTASFVVSGSIVVAGNSIHWIEQEGTCDDGKIRNAVADLSDSLASMGGMVVTTSKELLDWLMFWKEKEESKALEEQGLQEEQDELLDSESLGSEVSGSESLNKEPSELENIDNESEAVEMLETRDTSVEAATDDLSDTNKDN